MTYELTWVRTLSLIFGVSSQAITAVLSAFMGGLALGSLIFGHLADRSRSPLRLYAVLEVGIGVSALLLPYLFLVINGLYVLMAQTFPSHSWLFTTTRFLLCFAALLVPTTLMGGTLPAISRFLVVRFDRVGRGVGLLYGANTVGGILGCLVTGFLLLRFLGAHATTLVAVALNLIVALVALRIAARYDRVRPVSPTTALQPPHQQNAASESAPPRHSVAEAGHQRLGTFVLVSFGVAGATSLAYEVLWTRVLIYFVGMTIYSFTIILATFLTGLALGSLCFARIADRRKDLLLVFGLLELAIGLCAVYLLQTTGMVLSFRAAYFPWLELFADDLAKVSLLMLVPTFLMGAVFPIVTKLYTPSVSRLGGSLGRLYAANTIGAVAGSLLAGFVLLPVLGAQKSIILVAAVNLVLGILALLLSPARTRLRQWALGVAIPALLVGGFLAAHIRPTVTYCDEFQIEGLNQLLYYHEGAEASLAVLGGSLDRRGLNINGKTTAYTSYGDIIVHKMLGHIPVLLAKDPHTALVIGFGLGSTVWSMAQYPLQRIDCVELVPEEIETARFFLPDNGGVLDDPRFHFIVGDGRNYLLASRNRYDVISMNAIHPAISPYLYTREFYQLCRSRLGEDGVMCAWLPTNAEHFATLLKTFQSVFPHTSVWFCGFSHLVLTGSPEPLRIDFSRWQARMSQTAVRDNLAEVWLDDPVHLLSNMILNEDTIEAACAQAAISTDDFPRAQFERLYAPV
ncbi:MAG: fused MFS/spermidine synthase, partial [Armatimonadetes bacterium]|nr:fused MFS/spermidine synthase [Armatimonadota bacterium]